jgi:putative ABC transport system permease protein
MLRALWNRRRRESELEDEIAFHLSEEADERRIAGDAPADAIVAARRDFGNVQLVRETTREAWGWGSAERLFQDARSGARTLRRDRGFAAVAVLTLALGIGATTAILNVVHALLVRPLPFPEADRLVILYATTPAREIFRDTTSFHDFKAWKNESQAFVSAAAYRQEDFNITGDGVPEPLRGLRATNDLLAVLGAVPAAGRMFDAAEQRSAAAVAVISHELWVRRYGSDPSILSRTIVLNDATYAVVGVLPPGFQFPAFQPADVILPLPERTCRACGYLRGVAKLQPVVPVATAQRELDGIALGRAKTFPDSNAGRGVSVVPLAEVAVGAVRTPLLVLLGAGLFVLLIGCVNVGNLALARSLSRRREFAIRSALGAGIARLVRQLLTESVVLALAAAALGAVLAAAGSNLLAVSLAERLPLPAVTVNWPLLVVAAGIALVSGVLSGLPAVAIVWKSDLSRSLRHDGRGQPDRAQRRARQVLVTVQTALAVVLLVGAGLLLRSFVLLRQVDLGLDPRGVLTADLLLSKVNAAAERRDTFLHEILAAVRSVPGVEFAGTQTDSPFGGGGSRETYTIDGLPNPSPTAGHAAATNLVAGELFQSLGIPIVRGRGFDRRDTWRSLPVAVINETMARTTWPGRDPLGQRMRLFYDRDPHRWLTIVGVVRDVVFRYESSGPQVFLPEAQRPYRSLPYAKSASVSFAVRTSADPGTAASAVRSAIWSIEKNQPIRNLQPLDQILWRSVAESRVYALLVGLFAAIAFVIAATGIYALCAFMVARRTPEIGIRLAIGATHGQILSLVLRGSLGLTLAGVGGGIAAALALSRVLTGILHGVAATDAPTIASVVLIFMAVAAIATYIPARRASRIDPTFAVRCD